MTFVRFCLRTTLTIHFAFESAVRNRVIALCKLVRAIDGDRWTTTPPPNFTPTRMNTKRATQLLTSSSILAIWLSLTPTICLAQQVDDEFAAVSTKFLQQHCVRCHGPDLQEGEYRFDRLETASEETIELWNAIVAQVRSENMPPSDEVQPSDKERALFLSHASRSIELVTPPAIGLRRMSRTEYEFTVQDLLGIDTPLKELLPEDSEVEGFDNVATGLDFSSILMERYLEAANVAFEATIRRIEPLPPSTRRISLVEQKDNVASIQQNKGGVIEKHGAFIDFTPGWPPARIDPAHPIEGGVYRCRVAVWPHDPSPHRTLTVAIYVGPLFGTGKRRLIDVYDVTGTPDDPRIIEFESKMDEGDALHILPWIYPEHVTWRDKEEPRPGVGIVWAETYGPLDQTFPSESTKQLFGDHKSIQSVPTTPIWMRHRKGVKTHVIESSDPKRDAQEILTRFAQRAFRRPVDSSLIEPFRQLVVQRLDEGSTFEQAVQAGVVGVLCSPHFLLLNIQDEVDDYELASRLSYFLWSSLPDKELLELAAENQLSEPKVFHQQVDRMLADEKSKRFVLNFVNQWLDLKELEFTTPDQTLYPEYDELLLDSMHEETIAFVQHLLSNNLSISNFIESDFVTINQRLADHYQIPAVRGHEQIRVVPVPEGNVRGGILTQASVLKVTANGTNTSPVIRGSWVLENILGQPPLPPPAGVPAVEPDIRGATTIREQLDKHRENESCNRCHARIDPPGFALEEFDVIGGQRSYYRSLGKSGERVAKTNYRVGPKVETDGQMTDGSEFTNFESFRELLKSHEDVFARAFASKLLTYASGRPVTAADEEIVQKIVADTEAEGNGLRTMIHHVVDSELFRRR